MRLPIVKRIDKADLERAEKTPKWVDPLMSTLNAFMEAVALALRGRLTFEDNFLCKPYQGEFTSGVAIEINPRIDLQTNLRVTGVLLVSCGGLRFSSFGWSQLQNGNISVTVDFAAGTSSTCKLIILLG